MHPMGKLREEEKMERKRKRQRVLAAISKKKDEEEEKVSGVYISFSLEVGNCWFCIDFLSYTGNSNTKIKTKSSTPDERTLKLHSPLCRLPIYHPGSLALGSNIYVFGGWWAMASSGSTCKKALVYNTDDGVWTKLPKMLAPRVAPKVVHCGGYIFVLGCSETPQPWGEALDIDNYADTWSPVPAPPPPPFVGLGGKVQTTVISCVVLQNPPRILAYMTHSRTTLLYFDLQDWKWHDFPDFYLPLEFPLRDHPHPFMMLSQNILYFFFDFKLFFYDFDNPFLDGRPQRVFGCFPDVPRPFPPLNSSAPLFPFSLGAGHFCLIWSPCSSHMIHCFRFRIDIRFTFEDEPFRHATYLGCDRFELDGVVREPINRYCALPWYTFLSTSTCICIFFLFFPNYNECNSIQSPAIFSSHMHIFFATSYCQIE